MIATLVRADTSSCRTLVRNGLARPVRRRSSRFCRWTYGIQGAVSLNLIANRNGCANAPVNVPNAIERDATVTVNPMRAANAIAPATPMNGISISAAAGGDVDTTGAPTIAHTAAATTPKLATPASVSAAIRAETVTIFANTIRLRLTRTSSQGHVPY